ncbi:MAG: vWA domain-containing protein [Hyphomicrobiaceae bacterium]
MRLLSQLMRHLPALTLLVGWLAWPMTTPTAVAQTSSSVAVVMDSSGSMWGKLTGGTLPKFQAATNIMQSALRAAPPGSQVSLVSFGQRSRGGCGFADVLLPLSPYNESQVAAGFRRLNPQGRGPLVRGIQTAAEALSTAKGPKSIIVVHDDPDNCGQDVCAAASALKQALPELRIFVLSLEPKAESRGAMACLARITGGRVIETNNEATTETAANALVRAALATAAPRRTSPRETARPQTKQSPKTTTDRSTTPRRARARTPGLMLSARLAKNGPELNSGVLWTIRATKASTDTGTRRTANARPSIPLEPGLYDVTMQASGRIERRSVEVKKGPRTIARFDLDAAALSFTATLQDGGAIVQDAIFELRAAESAKGKVVWNGLSPRDPLVLPAGTYHLTVTADRVRRQTTVALQAGQRKQLSIPLEAGYLTVNTILKSGERAQGTTITVEVDDAARPSGRRIIARSIQSMPSFLLPAGTYYVTASLGTAMVQDQVGIRVGKIIEQTISIPFMRLEVLSQLRGRKDQVAEGLRYRVWQLRSPDSPPLVSQESQPTFQLAPGPYRIESRIGAQNAVVVRDFEVTPAPAGKLTLQHDAGTIQLGVDPKIDPREIYWEIRTQDDTTIWRSLKRQPLVTLKAGNYRIVAEVDGQTSSNEITVDSGGHLNIRLGHN